MVDTNLLQSCQKDAIASFCYQSNDGQIYTFPISKYCNFSESFDRYKGGLKWIILWVVLLIILPIILAFLFYNIDGGSGSAYNIAVYTLIGLICFTILYVFGRTMIYLSKCPKKWQKNLSVARFPIFPDSVVWKPTSDL